MLRKVWLKSQKNDGHYLNLGNKVTQKQSCNLRLNSDTSELKNSKGKLKMSKADQVIPSLLLWKLKDAWN